MRCLVFSERYASTLALQNFCKIALDEGLSGTGPVVGNDAVSGRSPSVT